HRCRPRPWPRPWPLPCASVRGPTSSATIDEPAGRRVLLARDGVAPLRLPRMTLEEPRVRVERLGVEALRRGLLGDGEEQIVAVRGTFPRLLRQRERADVPAARRLDA